MTARRVSGLMCTRYYVVDSTEALSKFGQDAWDRVVCVMTTGQAWQFKPYKWNDPKVLFHHGTYYSYLLLEDNMLNIEQSRESTCL